MNTELKKLPVGIESFQEIRTEDFYYIDKTGLIRELLNRWSKVNLFTRPRRFGKSLNMSMLKAFLKLAAILVFLMVWTYRRRLRFARRIWGSSR